MSQTVSSPDISVLDFSVLLDMSAAIPTVRVTNLSTGITDPTALQWVFELLRPSGYPVHAGNFTTPDIDGAAFTTYTFTETIPTPMRQLEFHNINKYIVKVSVKDSLGNVFYLSKGQPICAPNGNTGQNNFGAAQINVETKCAQGLLLVTDKTNLIYKSVQGTKVSTTVNLKYPLDKNGNQFVQAPVAQLPCFFTLKYDAKGYSIYVAHVFDYDLGDDFIVRVRYSFNDSFDVTCNVNLQPLLCEVGQVADVIKRNCNEDTADNRRKRNDLNLATVYLMQAVMGIVEPLSKVDVPAKAQAVKEILGLNCDCSMPAGISNIGTALFTDAIVTPNKVCGDILISWENDGAGNITMNYSGASYTFVISNKEGNSAAFYFNTAVTDCNKEVQFFVDLQVLSTEILSTITNSPTLLNILNGITQRAQLVCSGLNGGTAFNLSTCDYSLEFNAGVAGSTIVSILIGGVTYNAPGGTLLANASAIQTWLNGLAKGAFVVSYNSITNKTSISSNSNTNLLASVVILISGSTRTVLFNSNCGLICNILQKIFDYLNALNLVQIKSGQELTVCRFNANGTVLTKTFDATVGADVIVKYMADSFCNMIDYVKSRLLSCENLNALFASFTIETGNPGGADIFFMRMNGTCQIVPLKNVAISILRQIQIDEDVKNEFCLISPCSSVSDCSPVADLTPSAGTDTTQTFNWSAVAGAVGYKWSIDGTNYTQVTSTTAFMSGLTADTSYTFRVYPVYSFGNGTSCEVTADFITTDTGVTCAAPANLVLNNVTDTAFRASWDAVTGASGYQYSVNGGGWVNNGTSLNAVISGLTPDTNYNFNVRAIIGGTPCGNVAGDNVTTDTSGAINVYIQNGVTSLSIDSSLAGGSPYFLVQDGAFPLGASDSLDGIHNVFSGVITLDISGVGFVASCANLIVNGTFFDSTPIPAATAGTYSFNTRAYLSDDQIVIQVVPGSCGA